MKGLCLRSFNPRSREGSDIPTGLCRPACRSFNPRSREGSDGFPAKGICRIRRFQSTLPRRERHNSLYWSFANSTVSIHAPAKGATSHADRTPGPAEFQSTLPRRERHVQKMHKLGANIVSIHAPAKGATCLYGRAGIRNEVSIHAPAKGATFMGYPRSFFCTVSIHAPAKGATLFTPATISGFCVSIHAPAKGATPFLAVGRISVRFQSTLPRRERRERHAGKRKNKHGFNPRSREGNDPGFLLIPLGSVRFNPRSREGNDEFNENVVKVKKVSIHAPAKGTTPSS